MVSRWALRFGCSLLAVGIATGVAAQEKVLRIAMTAADIPRTLGQPDQGFEGNRFTGIPIYDALTHWDLSKEKEPSVLIPGLATEWKVTDDKTKWQFKLRPGVKFHDGSDFNAAAVVWNVQKVLDKSAPHFDPSQVGVTASRMPTLRSAAHGRRHDRRAHDIRAGLVPADQPDEPVHGLAHPLGREAEGGSGLGDGRRRTREAGLGGVCRRSLRVRPVSGDPLRVARAARACSQRDLLGREAPAEDSARRPAAAAGGECPHGRPPVGPGRLDRGSGA
jgi:hypothetical protein